MGEDLLRNFHTLGVLGHVCDANEKVLAAIAAHYTGVPATSDYEEVIANKEISALALATNAEHHAWMAEKAMLAGEDFPVAAQYQDEILSLPIFPELRRAQMDCVADSMRRFFAI